MLELQQEKNIVFIVDCPKSSAVFTSGFLVLSIYSSDGKTDCVIFSMAIISVAD